MTHYQTPDDLKFVAQLTSLAPVEAKAFLDFNHACERRDGAIPPKYRELISLAVALTTQCAYCLDVHSRAAAQAGATREELAETAMIAAAVRAGGSLAHALLALRLFDQQASRSSSS
jgi:AhpD family alkylhydroperoxidase